MPLDTASADELWRLRDTLVNQFENRTTKWRRRRDIRYRRMTQELKKLPLNSLVSDTALIVQQTELPNQDCHKRVKRLIANKPRFEIVLSSGNTSEQSMGQKLEDGLKALYKWMTRSNPAFEWQVVEYQQGDGLGIAKIDFLPDHGASLAHFDLDDIEKDDEPEDDDDAVERNKARRMFREELEAAQDKDNPEALAFGKATDRALRAELPPYRLSAVDPLTCSFFRDGDGIATIVEAGKKSLHPLLEALNSAGYPIEVKNNRLILGGEGSDVVSGRTAPDYVSIVRDLSMEVGYAEIRTRNEIVLLIEHPDIKDVTPDMKSSDRGVHLVFPNPFGPYTTGYALVYGDITTEADPADEFQPPILGLLNLAQPDNVLATALLSAAVEEALAPSYVKVSPEARLPATDESKAPDVQQGREIAVVQGDIKKVETPKTSVERVSSRILQEQGIYTFQEALQGDATSDTSGHRLALQIAQADIQAVPYQNARADALAELMKGIIYSVRKHGLPVYIPTLPNSARSGKKLRVSEPAVITPEMADLNFDLLVTLGAETAVTKYAKWQATSQREAEGSLGYLTMMEQSDVENPEDEIARVFEGKMLKATMEGVMPEIVKMVIQRAQQKLQLAMGPTPGSGLAEGGGQGGGIEDIIRLPGVNMPVAPSVTDQGPPVMEGGGDQPITV
ncbi:hypothetical protein LCGC14_0310530 [marine sediment metagenome]|uniref:Portal protein n=1 Tax=marine sediment metagenome TaxID=412755 RepID=A0A0F9TM50_9ZZZZ